MVNVGRRPESQLNFLYKVIPMGQLGSCLEPVKPLKDGVGHVKSNYIDTLVIRGLMEGKEMGDLG